MALLGLPVEERSPRRFELRSRSFSTPSLSQKVPRGSAWALGEPVALPRATGASRVPGPRVARTRTPETPAARPAPTPAARNLEDRLRHRQRCFGTLRASWRVKNFFSAWRSLVQMQNEALRVQQDHEAQLRAILDLRELLAQKELEVRQLSLLLATSRRKRSTLEHGIHIIQTGASDLVICLRVLGAWRRLSREGRLTDALRRVEADAQQREANLERELMLQLEEATATIRRLEGELRSSERRHRVLSEEIASLQRLLDEAELQQRKARQQRAARSERLAAGRSELEAKAVAWALWLRAIALLRCERHELQVMEHELALKDAAERHRLEVQEWERRLQERLAEIEALGQQRDQELRGSQDVFDLELARVHQAHADDRKTREEEHRLQAERHQLALEELQRQQFEAKQKLLMSSLAALNGQRAEGLRRDYFLAWAQYLVHVRRIRSEEWKEQELQRLQAQHDALHGKLQEREAAFARHRTNRGDQVATTKQKLWISQVLGAWLLVAVAMRLARARELEASEADRLRAELQRLSLESGRALRSQAGETLELRRRQALLLQILRSWLRIVWQQHLQARQSETAEVSRRLGGRNSRKDLQTDRLGQQLLLQASSVLLASAFHAWSKTAGLLRLDRAAQKMISKMDFLRRSGQSRRDQLLGKSEYLGQVCLARLVLAVWAQAGRFVANWCLTLANGTLAASTPLLAVLEPLCSPAKRMPGKCRLYANVIAFWILGLLNNFLWVVLNAGANEINSAGIALVYLANVLPSLTMKLSGPYWFHYVSYKYRMWLIALLMVLCLLQVAWGQGPYQKLIGVGMASMAAGIGEASLLAMASFYEAKPCLTAWSSGTGFAGIAGYVWSLLFDYLDLCFQVELMVALWLPLAFLLAFHCLLGPPWIDEERGARLDCAADSADSNSEELESEETESVMEHHASELATAKLSFQERFGYILSLWPYTVPLFFVYAAEYTIQSGFWAAMGFPVTDPTSRHHFYKWSNFMYQIGVFISRSAFILICRNRKVLWCGGFLQVVMALFFAAAAWQPFGDWWLLAPAFFVGCLGGGVYVGAFTLIAQEQPASFVELALSAASVADTFGMIAANIMGLLIQGCVFGHLQVVDEVPNFKCGYDIWDSVNKTLQEKTYHAHCFPGIKG
ncbi:BTN1 [Symbiodinium sp. KB8]|nr:BTN1 [Symbiodinium sp. KB8]